ncbi:MAG: YciI family protein [Pseudomonadota bacterium]
MPGYLFLYRNANEAEMSAEEMQACMDRWMKWIGESTEAGWMTEPGDALRGGRTVHNDRSTTDGPFAESKEIIGGYSIVQARDIEHATELAQGCPVFVEGGCLEIRELANVEIETPAQA